MTALCCTRCRLRFARAEAAYIVACPECGEPPLRIDQLQRSVGFRLYVADGMLDQLPTAIPLALPVIWPDEL